MTKTEYETASKIAPTVAQSAKFPDYGTPWQEMTLTIGRALGKEDKAKQLIADVDAKFAAARAKHPQFTGRSAVVAEVLEDSYVVRGATDPRTRFLISLGFVSPEEIGKVTGDNVGAQISPEQITLLDRDLLVWNADYSPHLPPETLREPAVSGIESRQRRTPLVPRRSDSFWRLDVEYGTQPSVRTRRIAAEDCGRG